LLKRLPARYPSASQYSLSNSKQTPQVSPISQSAAFQCEPAVFSELDLFTLGTLKVILCQMGQCWFVEGRGCGLFSKKFVLNFWKSCSKLDLKLWAGASSIFL